MRRTIKKPDRLSDYANQDKYYSGKFGKPVDFSSVKVMKAKTKTKKHIQKPKRKNAWIKTLEQYAGQGLSLKRIRELHNEKKNKNKKKEMDEVIIDDIRFESKNENFE